MTDLYDAMTEADLQSCVMDVCRSLHLLVYHTHDSRRSAAGFPDLVIVGRRLIVRELKTTRGKTTTDQDRWLAGLREAGVDAAVWRPSDWREGNVLRQLRALQRRGAT